MAKAQFHRNQRVWVECVGAWAVIERIVPVWAKDSSEPVRIAYDIGLGREFLADELQAEEPAEASSAETGRAWRILRARNKWQQAEDCGHHPHPGTFPVVVTDPQDWGGWRVPGAEYDRDPRKIEAQARMIVAAPILIGIAHDLQRIVAESPQDASPGLQELARRAADVLHHVMDESGGSPAREPDQPEQVETAA